MNHPELRCDHCPAGFVPAGARFPWRARAYVRAGSHYRAAPSLPARHEGDVATEWAAWPAPHLPARPPRTVPP